MEFSTHQYIKIPPKSHHEFANPRNAASAACPAWPTVCAVDLGHGNGPWVMDRDESQVLRFGKLCRRCEDATHASWRCRNWKIIIVFSCLKLVIFYRFYHSKSPWNITILGIFCFGSFSNHQTYAVSQENVVFGCWGISTFWLGVWLPRWFFGFGWFKVEGQVASLNTEPAPEKVTTAQR